MTNTEVLIYVSDECLTCQKLLDKMDKWDISYRTKNITGDEENKKELKDLGVYGTPATLINNEEEPILGYQVGKLKRELNIYEV